MTETWDDDDRAIAAALGAGVPAGADGPIEADAFADYEAVAGYLPFEEIAPRDLEDRVVAAALARRPAAVRSLEAKGNDAARAHRRARRSWIAAGAVAAAAAVIVVLLVAGRTTTGVGSTGARIEPAAATGDLARVLSEHDLRRGALRAPGRGGAGRVVLDGQGDGYLTGLPPAAAGGRRLWLWLDGASGPVRVGPIGGGSAVHFVVHGDVGAVRGVIVSSAPAGQTPSTPAPGSLRATLSS